MLGLSEKNTVVVVEDERTLRETVGYALTKEGYEVRLFADGMEAWEALEKEMPSLAILDILMPRMDGLELCRRLRAKSESLPILFLTSKDEEFDRVLGLELGADDYLCKPFSMRELMARVKVLLRRLALLEGRKQVVEEEILQAGPLRMDLQRYRVFWTHIEIPLTVTEFSLLRSLAQRPGHVKTRAQLLEAGYPHDAYVSERTVDSHIKRLRRKFEQVAEGFEAIETVYGLGYRYRLE